MGKAASKKKTRGSVPARAKYPGAWNNPGNLRPGSVVYPGQNGVIVKEDGSKFLTFDTPMNGLRAMANVVSQIARVKVPERFDQEKIADDRFTPRTLIEIYAPSEDNNDVDSYTEFVSQKLGVGVSDELNLGDEDQMSSLLEAMVRRDSGHSNADWFSKEEYKDAARSMLKGLETRQDAKGGRAEGTFVGVPQAKPRSAAPVSGPRIVINPSTFKNKKDALCVAFNERFRIAMEEYGFEPKSEPTPAQRKFFADTAYADDEVQLRRTILARVLTLDTSVKKPSDDQVNEALEFLQVFKEQEAARANPQEMQWLDRLERLVEAATRTLPARPRERTPARSFETSAAGARANDLGGETDETKTSVGAAESEVPIENQVQNDIKPENTEDVESQEDGQENPRDTSSVSQSTPAAPAEQPQSTYPG